MALLNSPKIAPYGSWKSPITSDLIVEGSVGLSQPAFDGDDIYWLELRPKEAGRHVIIRRTPDGVRTDVNPAPFNARTRVHEYGGGDYVVRHRVVYFSNFSDQRLYRQDGLNAPEALTAPGEMRYADATMDHARGRLICVREDHTRANTEAVNSIASVNTQPGENYGTVLVEGNDFYSTPRLSPDGTQLAWLTWNHPNRELLEPWLRVVQSMGSAPVFSRPARRTGSGWRKTRVSLSSAPGPCLRSQLPSRPSA